MLGFILEIILSSSPCILGTPGVLCWPQSASPCPQFRKNLWPSVTTGQSWTFGDAASLSEIGRLERTIMLGHGDVMKSAISLGAIKDIWAKIIRNMRALLRDVCSGKFPKKPLEKWLGAVMIPMHGSLMHHMLFRLVPRTSPSTFGSPQCYTWAGLPRYRQTGWLMLGGMTVFEAP